jgi:glutaredoxin-like protein
MTVIADTDREAVRELLARELVNDVEILFFTRSRSGSVAVDRDECETCDEASELLSELAGMSDRLQVTSCDVATDPTTATRYNVTAVPTVLLRRANTAGSDETSLVGANVRFLGLPSGYEFTTLLADIVDTSTGTTDLSEKTRAAVRAIDEPAHIQVFVTPSCPYCPRAARLAHKMAMENPLIVADVIEANEFPTLSQRYGVRTVPHTVINNRVQFVGAQPEEKVLKALNEAMSHA